MVPVLSDPLWLLCSRAAAQHGTWKTARITVVVKATDVIFCFHRDHQVRSICTYTDPCHTFISMQALCRTVLHWN